MWANSLFSNLFNALSGFLHKEPDYIDIDISIPREIYLRTQLICDYISEEEDVDFDLNSFIFLLFYDFIKECIEHYNPKKVFTKLTFNYIDKQTLVITNGYEKYEVDNGINFYNLNISFDKNEVEKGELILEELSELFHSKISFSTLIEQLWISFIYEYKTGDNKKAFTYLKRIIHANNMLA